MSSTQNAQDDIYMAMVTTVWQRKDNKKNLSQGWQHSVVNEKKPRRELHGNDDNYMAKERPTKTKKNSSQGQQQDAVNTKHLSERNLGMLRMVVCP